MEEPKGIIEATFTKTIVPKIIVEDESEFVKIVGSNKPMGVIELLNTLVLMEK
jgi:hypothetical protein